MQHDRVPREESYVKDFAPLDLGNIKLTQGPIQLHLTAAFTQPASDLEFRLLLLELK